MVERQHTELEPKRERLEVINQLIDKIEQRTRRLISEFGREADEVISSALRAEINSLVAQHEGLRAEQENLTAQLNDQVINPDDESEILRLAHELRREVLDREVTFEAKRFIIERLRVRVSLRHQGDERKLAVEAAIAPEKVSLVNYQSSE